MQAAVPKDSKKLCNSHPTLKLASLITARLTAPLHLHSPEDFCCIARPRCPRRLSIRGCSACKPGLGAVAHIYRVRWGSDGAPDRAPMGARSGGLIRRPIGPRWGSDGRPIGPPMGSDGTPIGPPMGSDGRPIGPPMGVPGSNGGSDGRPIGPPMGVVWGVRWDA